MLVDEGSSTVEVLNLVVVQVLLVDAIEALDVSVTLVLEIRPVERRSVLDAEAVRLAIVDGLCDRSRIPGDFLGHTAHVHACTSNSLVLDSNNFCAVCAAGLARTGEAARAAADDQVVGLFLDRRHDGSRARKVAGEIAESLGGSGGGGDGGVDCRPERSARGGLGEEAIGRQRGGVGGGGGERGVDYMY